MYSWTASRRPLVEGDLKLLKMEEALHHRIVGQEEAIEVGQPRCPPRPQRLRPAPPMARSCSSGRPRRQDGAGARAGGVLFESEDALIRIDRSEYMERFAVLAARGCPSGYVGYDEGGQLTNRCAAGRIPSAFWTRSRSASGGVQYPPAGDGGWAPDGRAGRVVDFKNTCSL